MTGQSNNRRRQWKKAALTVLAGTALVSALHFAVGAPPQVSPPASTQSIVSSRPFTLTAALGPQGP